MLEAQLQSCSYGMCMYVFLKPHSFSRRAAAPADGARGSTSTRTMAAGSIGLFLTKRARASCRTAVSRETRLVHALVLFLHTMTSDL